MTKQVWKIEKFATDKTDEVMSFTYKTGRGTQFDSWSPGSLVLTIRNDNGQANGYDLNDKIVLTAVDTNFYQWFYVQEVLFNDLGSTGAGSTAAIVCTDLIGRLGRISVFEKSLPSAPTLTQIETGFNLFMPSGSIIQTTSGGASIAAATATYTGTGLNRLNLNMVTEQGWLGVTDEGIYLYGRNDIADLAPGTITFARTASGSFQMGYSDIKRIALGSNYLNACTVTPPVAAAQNYEDATGVSAFGVYGAEFSTVDDSASQALGFAQWQVLSRDDPDELSFEMTVLDSGNDLTQLFNAIYLNVPVVTVSYKNPGDNTTFTSQQIMQGFSMSVVPGQTTMQITTSPLTYTQFFILNSDTFGVLNTSKLGW
jgi:hypothetical protein